MCLNSISYSVDNKIVDLSGVGWKTFYLYHDGVIRAAYQLDKYKINQKYKARKSFVGSSGECVYETGFHIHCSKTECLSRAYKDEEVFNFNDSCFISVLGKVKFGGLRLFGQDKGFCVVADTMEILELHQILNNNRTKKIVDIKKFLGGKK